MPAQSGVGTDDAQQLRRFNNNIEALFMPMGPTLESRAPRTGQGCASRQHIAASYAAFAAQPMADAIRDRELAFLRSVEWQTPDPSMARGNKYEFAFWKTVSALRVKYGMPPVPEVVAAKAAMAADAASAQGGDGVMVYEPLEGAQSLTPAQSDVEAWQAPPNTPASGAPLASVRTGMDVVGTAEGGPGRPTSVGGQAHAFGGWADSDSMDTPATRRGDVDYVMRAYNESFAELAGGWDKVRMQAPTDALGLTRPTDEVLARMGMTYQGNADYPVLRQPTERGRGPYPTAAWQSHETIPGAKLAW